MKNFAKKIVAFILAVVLAAAVFPVSGIKLEANALTGDDVVSYARQYLGCPYVSGATGPNAFDCSGFVSYVFGHFGISLPNSTYTIWNNMSSYGTVVDHSSLAKAKTGDIIVWSGHVAIYTSNGGCIEALNPRYGVTEALPVNSHTNGMNYYVLRVTALEESNYPPQKPSLSADKTLVNEGDTVTFRWDKVSGADKFKFTCTCSGKTVASEELTGTSKELKLTAKGTYYATVTAINSKGSAESNKVTVSVWEKSHVHRYYKTVKAATCEKDGLTTYTCITCREVYTEVIPATGHSFGDWVIITPATTASAGKRQHTCKHCKTTVEEVIPQLPANAVVIDKASLNMNYKSTQKLTANKSVTWSSSDSSVASVDADGNVRANKPGTAVITAVNGTNSSTCTVKVSYSWWQWIIRTALLGFLWY